MNAFQRGRNESWTVRRRWGQQPREAEQTLLLMERPEKRSKESWLHLLSSITAGGGLKDCGGVFHHLKQASEPQPDKELMICISRRNGMLQRRAAVKLIDFVKNKGPHLLYNCPLKKRQGVDKWSRTMSGVSSDAPTQRNFFSPQSNIYESGPFCGDIPLPQERGSWPLSRCR